MMIRDDYDASCQKAVMHSTGNNLIQRRKQPARLHMSTSMSQEYVELMIYLFESLMWRNSSRDRLKGNELYFESELNLLLVSNIVLLLAFHHKYQSLIFIIYATRYLQKECVDVTFSNSQIQN